MKYEVTIHWRIENYLVLGEFRVYGTERDGLGHGTKTHKHISVCVGKLCWKFGGGFPVQPIACSEMT